MACLHCRVLHSCMAPAGPLSFLAALHLYKTQRRRLEPVPTLCLQFPPAVPATADRRPGPATLCLPPGRPARHAPPHAAPGHRRARPEAGFGPGGGGHAGGCAAAVVLPSLARRHAAQEADVHALPRRRIGGRVRVARYGAAAARVWDHRRGGASGAQALSVCWRGLEAAGLEPRCTGVCEGHRGAGARV